MLRPPAPSHSRSSSVSSSASSDDDDGRKSLSPSVSTSSSVQKSSASVRTPLRDRLAAGLHEYFPALSLSGRVSARVVNQTPYPLQVVAWPMKVHYENARTDGDDADIQLSAHRGTAWENEVLPPDTILTPNGEEAVEIGSMRKAHSLQGHTHRGWIALDLVKPDGSVVHLQLFLHLSRHGIKSKTSLGRLDLDSNSENPQSSGIVGKTVFEKTGDYVTYYITPDVADIENTVDDSTKKASKLLFGKGVETTTYVHHQGCRINLFVGREARYHEHRQFPIRGIGEMRHTKHEVEGATSKFVGVCSQHLNKPFFKAHLKIHPILGIVETGKGEHDFANTLKTKAIFSEDGTHVLNYGFSDQGSGRSDQVYAYISKVHASWLGDLIQEDKRWLDVPFSKLSLAGAHDAGMWQALNPGLLYVIQDGTLADGLASNKAILDLGTPVVRALVRALESIKLRPDRALQNLANTQKDDSATLLRLGIRFFDFRPGFNFYDAVKAQKKEVRHQHAIVPGEEYVHFLRNILVFLAEHPHEIVFVELKSDGFVLREDKHDKSGKVVAYSMIPTPEELANCLKQAYADAGPGAADIVIAGARDLDTSIGDLIEQRKRLFIVDRVHNPNDWTRSDSYTHEAYGTDNPATIIAQLIRTHEESSKSENASSSPGRGCIYQLQATPTSRIVDAARSALTFSDASSLLVWMKAQQDRVTYPWIAQTEFNEPGNVIFLNDFCDGALVDHTIDVTRRRAGLLGPSQ